MNRKNNIKSLKRTVSLSISQNEFEKATSFLLNYNFIRKKIVLIGVNELIEDYENLIQNDIINQDKKESLKLILFALKMISKIVYSYPKQLSVQLLGYFTDNNLKYIEALRNDIEGDIRKKYSKIIVKHTKQIYINQRINLLLFAENQEEFDICSLSPQKFIKS